MSNKFTGKQLIIGANGLIGRKLGICLDNYQVNWTGTSFKRNTEGS